MLVRTASNRRVQGSNPARMKFYHSELKAKTEKEVKLGPPSLLLAHNMITFCNKFFNAHFVSGELGSQSTHILVIDFSYKKDDIVEEFT